ncbi:MRG domain-containing protein [Aphelenchoides bicaudatus]|nr:MRG domain-containing protein [Aphelenchoides bicaudatus]
MQKQDAPSKKHKIEPETADSPKVKRKPGEDGAYQLNDEVMCKYGKEGLEYRAKIIRVTSAGYEVHYQGWNKRYDEIISEEDSKKRFKRYNEEEEKKAKEKIKQVKKSIVTPKPAEKSALSTPRPKKPATEQKERKNTAVFDSLNALIDEDLAYVLCEENEKIVKHKKTPKHPADKNIESIAVEFLLTKDYTDGASLITELDTFENILPQSSQYSEVIACLLKIFNIAFGHVLVYEDEKSFFDEYNKKHNEERVKRYSSFLGFTHLLRFFTRLPDIVQKIPTENETSLKYLADGAADFCKYLSGSIDKYYNDAYYGA